MSLSYIPSPSFSSIHLGPITIHMYAICILIGIFAAIAITIKRWKRYGGSEDQIYNLALIAVPCGIIGGRIYHIITTPERFFGTNGDLLEMVRIWNGGMGIWGAIALGGLGAWVLCRIKHYPMALLADAIAPALLVAQAIGRLGNWFNQELFGSPTTLPWGLKVSESITTSQLCSPTQTCPATTLFHPTFLYELLWNLLGAAILLYISRAMLFVEKKTTHRAGTYFALYVIWYTIGRTFIEMLRIDYAHIVWGLRVNVWVSIGVCLCGLIAYVVLLKLGKPSDILIDKLSAITQMEEEKASDK